MLSVEMLSTGDEVLYGQIVDTNAAWLADYLFTHGLLMTRRNTVGDNLEQLIAILQERSQHADVLIVNGGLGPTSDDLSAEAAAKAAGDTLSEHPEWLERMERYFADRGRVMAPANRKQACIPTHSELVDNPVGTACGFMMRLNRCLMFFTPGVPSEFREMVSGQIIPRLQQEGLLSGEQLCLRMTTYGRSESELAQQLDDLSLPQGVALGYRSSMPIIELKLTGPASLRPQMDAAWQEVRRVAGESALYEGTEPLASRLRSQIAGRGWSIVTSERFTGGLLADAFNQQTGPLAYGEVLPELSGGESEPLEALLTRAQTLQQAHGADLALVSGSLQNGRIGFALATPDRGYAQLAAFGISHHGHTTQQQVALLQAQNLLRCWFNGWSLSSSRGWVTIEQAINLP